MTEICIMAQQRYDRGETFLVVAAQIAGYLTKISLFNVSLYNYTRLLYLHS